MGRRGGRPRPQGHHRGGRRRGAPARRGRRLDRPPRDRGAGADRAPGRPGLALQHRPDAGGNPRRHGRDRDRGRQERGLADGPDPGARRPRAGHPPPRDARSAGRPVTAKARPAPRLRLTDTTFRDAHQSLLAGRLRGEDIVRLARKMDEVGFYSLEAFGGATFETEIRHNGENPWDYLRQLKKAAPKTPIQALIRGQNLVAHRNFADDVVQAFIAHAADCGVDIFRIFDPLNDLRNMEAAIAAAKKKKRKVQGALCYAISPAHNLELWCTLAKGLQKLGCDVVVIKDTSGLLSPQTTWELVAALRQVVRIPIGVHSHCSSGMAPMAYMAAVEAGATILDTAISPLAWGTSQPATESVVAALAGGDYDTGIDLEKLIEERDATVTKDRKDYLQGLFGRPPRPADPELRQMVLGREEPVTIRPADLLSPQLAGARAELKKQGVETSTDNVLTYLLFPSLALSFFRGDLARKTPDEPDKNGDEQLAAEPASEA